MQVTELEVPTQPESGDQEVLSERCEQVCCDSSLRSDRICNGADRAELSTGRQANPNSSRSVCRIDKAEHTAEKQREEQVGPNRGEHENPVRILQGELHAKEEELAAVKQLLQDREREISLLQSLLSQSKEHDLVTTQKLQYAGTEDQNDAKNALLAGSDTNGGLQTAGTQSESDLSRQSAHTCAGSCKLEGDDLQRELLVAAEAGNIDQVRHLVQSRADVNGQDTACYLRPANRYASKFEVRETPRTHFHYMS
jgi:hypothetical protein